MSLPTDHDTAHDNALGNLQVLRSIERRVLWLSTATIDYANRVRPNQSDLKVGGHQASSASAVSLMTVLWFEHLRLDDRVSVKPHASPVLHAINYLLGELDGSYLTSLRQFGGLQAYPSRTKDPDPVDYSTGSVGIGATAPVWGAIARRYVNDHFGGAGIGRQYSLLGDAELDEGACWEAVLDPVVSDLGEVVWVVDLNRQSLDRVIPKIGTPRLAGMFLAAGWQVITLKYGQLLRSLFAQDGGEALRTRLDEMSNSEYQRMLRYRLEELRQYLPGSGPAEGEIRHLIEKTSDTSLYEAVRNLGGHDLTALHSAFQSIDDTRPTVILAYTIKGYGLPTQGHPQNHSALLTADQMKQLAITLETDLDAPWQRFAEGGPEAALCADVAARLHRARPALLSDAPDVPLDLGFTPGGVKTTQAALGRTLLDLSRAAPNVGARLVTISPDVTSSTNLGGWVNKVGVWAADESRDWFGDDAETILHWRERPSGQHIELGISETNLVSLLGELGATWSRWRQPLIPIGVLYDPFIERALEPWSFGIYAGGRSILVGTPSGVSLAPEGGAHQSIKTPSIGMEQPGCVSYEPAFAIDAQWTLLAAIAQLGHRNGTSAYLRLSTRPIDQRLARVPTDPAARERRRRQVVTGAYALARHHTHPALTFCAMGAVLPEVLEATSRLNALGFGCDVICITSPGLLFQALQARRGLSEGPDAILNVVFPTGRAAPMVTTVDGHPNSLAFLAGIQCVPVTTLGVTKFGQSGDIAEVYRYHGLDVDTIVGAALDLVD